MLGVNLQEEGRKLEQSMNAGATQEHGTQSAYRTWDLRAYRLEGGRCANRRVAELEKSFAPDRLFFDRVRRNGEVFDTGADTVLLAGDIVVVAGRRRVLLGVKDEIGAEVEDQELLDFPLVARNVVITNRACAGRTLPDLAEEHGRGVVLLRLVRGGEAIPFTSTSEVNRGDLLRISGRERDVMRAGKVLGYIERPSSETDVVFVGLGILIGGLVGMLAVNVGGLPLTLTASGGALIMGLVFGWLRSVRPTFGRIPEAALWVFDTIGLAVFIGVVGLGAGPTFVSGLRETGVSLLAVGLVVAVAPHLVALLFGRYVLKMNPIILFGACAGAGTVTAALRAIQDESRSKLPAIGYTVPYAIGNILLTAWGPVIVMLTK
jgi:putative transport protein